MRGFLDKPKGVTVFLRGGRGKDGATLYGRPRMHTTRAAALRVPDAEMNKRLSVRGSESGSTIDRPVLKNVRQDCGCETQRILRMSGS
jgi:hypothetical protein